MDKTCKKCGFNMVAKVVDAGITVWKCPFNHKLTEITNRPSAVHVPKHERYPYNLEQKSEAN